MCHIFVNFACSIKRFQMDIIRFFKNWTLAIAIALGAAVYFIFANIPILYGIGAAISPTLNAILPITLFLVLFVTFCKVDYRKLKPVKWHFWSIVVQLLFVILLLLPVLVFHFSTPFSILFQGLIACAIGPGASAAAVVTQKLGGKLEEMTTFTFISNFVAAFTIPLCFPLIGQGVHIAFMDTFSKILYDVCVVLLMPILFAYVVKHHFHRFHRWIIGVKDLSYYLWALSLVFVSGTTVKNIVHAETTPLFLELMGFASLLLCIILFAVGRTVGRHFNSTIEFGQAQGQKNTVFAIWVAYSYLNPIASIGPGCYVLWQNIINSVEIWAYRKKDLALADNSTD